MPAEKLSPGIRFHPYYVYLHHNQNSQCVMLLNSDFFHQPDQSCINNNFHFLLYIVCTELRDEWMIKGDHSDHHKITPSCYAGFSFCRIRTRLINTSLTPCLWHSV